MATKACKQCKTIVEDGNRCPNCGSDELADSFKGKVVIINPEKSLIAQNMKHTKKGVFAVKIG